MNKLLAALLSSVIAVSAYAQTTTATSPDHAAEAKAGKADAKAQEKTTKAEAKAEAADEKADAVK